MSVNELSSVALGVPFGVRPLTWPAAKPRTRHPPQAAFRAPWSSTLELLKSEIRAISPVRVLLEIDVAPSMIRVDGFPRADARPASSAVILRIERKATQWMSLPCDTYSDWRDNVRAIALTLQHLRAIDRWGVSRGEQYEGFLQIPARTVASTPGIHSPQEAAGFIARHAGQEADPSFVHAILESSTARATAFKRAASKLHPDAGGSDAAFQQLQSAMRMIELNAGDEG